jgi:hypothetical protein
LCQLATTPAISTVLHPATSSHSGLSAERAKVGIRETGAPVAGIEEADDIIADLDQACPYRLEHENLEPPCISSGIFRRFRRRSKWTRK